MAKQGGTEYVKVIFKDSNGVSLTPYLSWWTLHRETRNTQTGESNGYVVNDRYQQSISSDDYYTDNDGVTQADIVLQGNDLPAGTLIFTAKGLIDTDKGTDLPVIVQKKINVEDIKYV